jgi:hypothetical protein
MNDPDRIAFRRVSVFVLSDGTESSPERRERFWDFISIGIAFVNVLARFLDMAFEMRSPDKAINTGGQIFSAVKFH